MDSSGTESWNANATEAFISIYGVAPIESQSSAQKAMAAYWAIKSKVDESTKSNSVDLDTGENKGKGGGVHTSCDLKATTKATQLRRCGLGDAAAVGGAGDAVDAEDVGGAVDEDAAAVAAVHEDVDDDDEDDDHNIETVAEGDYYGKIDCCC